MFRKHLHKAEDSVLYEIFYYDNVTSFRHQLHASPRSAIHRALGDPANYLEVIWAKWKCTALRNLLI